MGEGSINVELDDLARADLLSRTRREIAQEIVEAYIQKPEFEELVNSVKIDADEVHKMVMDELVDRIIKKFKEE